MDPEQPDPVPWSSTELRDILDHQMETELVAELDRFAELEQKSHEEVRRVLMDSGAETFEAVLLSARPAEKVLRLVKDFAKASMREGGDLPRDVARVMYVLAVLRGHACCADGISSLDHVVLDREARRCLTCGWLPGKIAESIRSLCAQVHG